MNHNILCVVGTRPEAIKMAPVIGALRQQSWIDTTVVSTGQHRELLHQTFANFGIVPDLDLDLMEANQSLSALTARVIAGVERLLLDRKPSVVIAQGDTTTVMSAAICCFYLGVPFAHVEAGLRSGDLQQPFPEEFNRAVASLTAAIHFAPTSEARDNLLKEGIVPWRVSVTGNTVIDALLRTAASPDLCDYPWRREGRMILVTSHRRENFGKPLEHICEAIIRVHDQFPDVHFVYPIHPNPNVRKVVEYKLGGLDRIRLIEPVGYREMISLLMASHVVLTDSGGIQEEAPALAKPVLVMRNTTERPEAIQAAAAKLVGTDCWAIVSELSSLLSDESHYGAMTRGGSPYGDGGASARIVESLRRMLEAGDVRWEPVQDWVYRPS